jgi:hypothetical protein
MEICQHLKGTAVKSTNVKGRDVSGIQALRTFESGKNLNCPICNAVLASIPSDISPGTGHISGLVCPINNRHYLVYGEDAIVMKKAREILRSIAEGKNK